MVSLKELILFVAVCVVSTGTGLVRQKRIVGGYPAQDPPIEQIDRNAEEQSSSPPRPPDLTAEPVVFLKKNRRAARVYGSLEPEGYYAFRGIRYAHPPIGRLRFQRPKRMYMEGEVIAHNPPPPCPQPGPHNSGIIGSEDCLFLNVFTPQVPFGPTDEGLNYPVIMWIHGGGFRRGSSSQYGVADLVKKGLVVVTVQYRLGSLGFLSIGRKELPGNAALFDLISSLLWIRDYITFFGGNPRQIVPSGQGSGASAAVMLALTEFSRGSISGVFAMSGSALSSFAVDDNDAKTAEEISAINGCNLEEDGVNFVRCMQHISLDSIINGDSHLENNRLTSNGPSSFIRGISSLLVPGPAVEGQDDGRFLPNFLTNQPLNSLQAGNYSRIPLLTGVVKDETSTTFLGGFASGLLQTIEAIPDYLEKSLVPGLLQVNSGLFSNGTVNPLLNSLFSNNNYLQAFTSSLQSASSNVDKVIQVTTDALFNLPAFLTSQFWSKGSNSYLYSFEHVPKNPVADYFLEGHPLVDKTDDHQIHFNDCPAKTVSHGEDLVYLFDVRSLSGQPTGVPPLQDPKDLKVRDHFTTLVAEFARSGRPMVAGQSVPRFTGQDGDYLVMSYSPQVRKGFRRCQMGLWAGITELLQSAQCSSLGVGELVGQLTSTLGQSTNGLLGATGLTNLRINPLVKTANIDGLTNGLSSGNAVGDLLNPLTSGSKKAKTDQISKTPIVSSVPKVVKAPQLIPTVPSLFG